MKSRLKVVVLLFTLLCALSISCLCTVSEAYDGNAGGGCFGAGGSGETKSVIAWGFRFSFIKHDNMYVQSGIQTGDIDRLGVYEASLGITDEGRNLPNLNGKSPYTVVPGFIYMVGGHADKVVSGKSKKNPDGTGDKGARLVVYRDKVELPTIPISIIDKKDFIYQDEVTGEISDTKEGGSFVKRSLIDAVLYNPVKKDYKYLNAAIKELNVQSGYTKNRRPFKTVAEMGANNGHVLDTADKYVDSKNTYKFEDVTNCDWDFIDTAHGSVSISQEDAAAKHYHYCMAQYGLGAALQRFIQPVGLSGNNNYRQRTSEKVSKLFKGKDWDNWTFYADEGRKFAAKAFAYAAYLNLYAENKNSQRKSLSKALESNMEMGKEVKEEGNSSKLIDLSKITTNWQLYVEPVVCYEGNYWESYQTAARARTGGYKSGTVQFGTSVGGAEVYEPTSKKSLIYEIVTGKREA